MGPDFAHTAIVVEEILETADRAFFDSLKDLHVLGDKLGSESLTIVGLFQLFNLVDQFIRLINLYIRNFLHDLGIRLVVGRIEQSNCRPKVAHCLCLLKVDLIFFFLFLNGVEHTLSMVQGCVNILVANAGCP